MDMAVERLFSVIDHLHGATSVKGQHAEVYLKAHILTGAERPAHACEGEAHLVFGQTEGCRDLGLVGVKPLGGDVEFHAFVFARHRHARLHAHERLVLHADFVCAFNHDLACGILVAPADGDLAEDVAVGVDRVGCDGFFGIADGGERFVIHDDGIGCFAGGFWVVGGNDGYRFALIADFVFGKHRLVGMLQTEDFAAGDVIVKQNRRDAADGQSGGDVNGADVGSGVGRPKGVPPEHPVGPKVGRECEHAANFGHSVWPGRTGADSRGLRSGGC